jgi:hypothetical protein
MMRSDMITEDKPRATMRDFKKWLYCACAAGPLLIACGSDGTNITCGKGTRQKGSTCVATEQPVTEADAGNGSGGDGGSGPGSGGASGAGTGGSPAAGGAGPGDAGVVKDVIDFAGVTSAAPGAATPAEVKGTKTPAPDSIRLSWRPATYPGYPLASLK